MAVSQAELKVILSAQDQMSAALKDAQRSLDDMGKSASGLSTSLALVGKAAAAAGLAIAGGLAIGVKGAGDLQQSVANISTIKPEINTSEVFGALNDLSTRVPQSAKQLGDSLYNVFSSIEVTQGGALQLVEKFAKGAVGAQTDAETFGTAVLGVMNAYGLKVEDADHISDVFFNTVNKGVVTGDELAHNLGLVTQAAKSAGVPLDDLGGFIAGVTKEGGPAAQNINNLNNFLLKVTTQDAQKELNKLGVATVDATGKFRAMPDVLTDLKGHLDTMTEAERTAALQKIFPDLQARAGAQVLISQLDFVKGAIEENKQSAGSASSAFEKMNATFNSQLGILGNTFNSILVTLGAEILPVITPIVSAFAQQLPGAFAALRAAAEGPLQVVKDAFATMAQVFQGDWAPDATQIQPFVNAVGIAAMFVRDQLLPAIQNLLTFLGDHLEIVAGFGAALLAMAAIAGTVAAISAVAAALAFILSPIGLIVVAVGVLTAAWIGNWGDIQGKTQAVISWFQNAGKTVIDALNAINKTLVSWLNSASSEITGWLNQIGDAWTAGWNTVTTFLSGVWDTILTIFGVGLAAVNLALTIGIGLWWMIFVQPFLDLLTWFNDVFWTPLVTLFNTWIPIITAAITAAWTLVRDKTIEIWTAISTWFNDTFWTPLKTFVTTTTDAIVTVITTAWQAISDKTKEIWDAIMGFLVNTIWTPISTKAQEIFGAIKTFILDQIWTPLKTTTETIWNGIKGFLDGIFTGVQSSARSAMGPVPGIFDSAWSAVKSGVSSVLGGAVSAAKKMFDDILSAADKARKAIEKFISSVGDAASKIPKILKPGSPPPLADGFDYIAAAIGRATGAASQFGGALGGLAMPSGSIPMPTGDLVDYARKAAERWGVPPDLFVRQINQESGFNPLAGSPAGAMGIAQFMSGTAAAYGVNPWDPYSSLEGAAHHMADLYRMFGDWRLALAAYNAGAGAVQQYGGVPPYTETQDYVRKILGYAQGGIIPGLRGQPQMAVVHGGEAVLTPAQQAALLHGSAGGGGEIHIHIDAPVYGVNDMETVVVRAINLAQRRGRL